MAIQRLVKLTRECQMLSRGGRLNAYWPEALRIFLAFSNNVQEKMFTVF